MDQDIAKGDNPPVIRDSREYGRLDSLEVPQGLPDDLEFPLDTGLEESIRRFFLFIMRDLGGGVAFDDADASKFSDRVVIVDPANSDNNVAARIERDERDALVATARQAYETITWAQGLPGKGETIAAWKELFGDNFSID